MKINFETRKEDNTLQLKDLHPGDIFRFCDDPEDEDFILLFLHDYTFVWLNTYILSSVKDKGPEKHVPEYPGDLKVIRLEAELNVKYAD